MDRKTSACAQGLRLLLLLFLLAATLAGCGGLADDPADSDDPALVGGWPQDDSAAGRVVAMGSFGDLVTVDAATGAERWRRDLRPLAEGDEPDWAFSASPLLYRPEGGPGAETEPLLLHLGGPASVLALGDDCVVRLGTVDREGWSELASRPLDLDGTCYALPSLVGRRLFARDDRHGVAVDLALATDS